MPTVTIWGSIQNGGDGSAYPEWMESEKLAEWDQENVQKDWGESCVCSVTVSSDGPITIDTDLTTAEEYYWAEVKDNDWNNLSRFQVEDFEIEFFPNGVPPKP